MGYENFSLGSVFIVLVSLVVQSSYPLSNRVLRTSKRVCTLVENRILDSVSTESSSALSEGGYRRLCN